MKIDTNGDKIDELLTRSVEEILPTREGLRDALMSGRRLRIYIGTDATGTSLHLGHATNYMILEKFRALGHEVIFLIGDFTARIGDPTDKGEMARKQLTRAQVVEHVQTWTDQIRPVIDIDNKDNPVKIMYNHEWLSALTVESMLDLASNFTAQQMLERDMFQARIKSNKPLYLHELFYPIMQGYDSVAMDVDIEMCGMDQKFNALAGRTLLRKLKNKEKFVFITTLLENPKTGEKMMSKSLGTGVFLDFDANKMYGAIMSQPDENMKQLFIDGTRLNMDEISQVLKASNPRDAKMRLAKEITSIYHGKDKADEAEQEFIRVFQKKENPEEVLIISADSDDEIMEILFSNRVIKSRGEYRRLVDEGAVALGGQKIDDVNKNVGEGGILRLGKKRFVNLVPVR